MSHDLAEHSAIHTGCVNVKESDMAHDPKDPKKPLEVPPEETPDDLPDIPDRPIEEPGPDVVPEEAPDVTPIPGEEVPTKMNGRTF